MAHVPSVHWHCPQWPWNALLASLMVWPVAFSDPPSQPQNVENNKSRPILRRGAARHVALQLVNGRTKNLNLNHPPKYHQKIWRVARGLGRAPLHYVLGVWYLWFCSAPNPSTDGGSCRFSGVWAALTSYIYLGVQSEKLPHHNILLWITLIYDGRIFFSMES